MNRRIVSARVVLGLIVVLFSSLGLVGCRAPLYYYPANNFAGRVTPPSGLLQRVMATYTNSGTGGAEILDGYRDLRRNIQNTIPSFFISGYSGSNPATIINFPEQQYGYILDTSTGSLASVNYATERGVSSAVLSLGANAPAAAAATDGSRFIGATATAGQLIVSSTVGSAALNLPNVYRVAMNQGNTVLLAMTRNSNSLYRVIQLPQTSNPVIPPGSVDCEPLPLPIYCAVPVKGNYDRPTDAYFSLDGAAVYVLNCGPECGGTRASVSVLQTAAVTYNNIPTVDPLSASGPSPLATLPVANPIPVPGGATVALSDGSNLYLAGQALYPQTSSGALATTPRADGLFSGYLSVLSLSSYTVGNPVSISDGTHTRLLFADDNTLWAGANQCANGERNATGQNVNCLAMVKLGTTPTATIIPAVVAGGTATVPYPNTNGNLYSYGNLTGICWVQNYHKVYTAYGGQIHVFNTTDGSEIDNTNVTIQGTVLDVAYMDALTNSAN